jgi:DNA-directed RNA polymerase specialized sigma24 family protein
MSTQPPAAPTPPAPAPPPTRATPAAQREQALFLAWRAGDERSGAALLGALRPKLLAYLRRRAPGLAEDLAHDALVALVTARDTLEDGRALHAYLFTAARRIGARERARRGVAGVELDGLATPAALTCRLELDRIDVERLLTIHGSRCTATVAEYYLGGHRAPEIARREGVSESTVRSQLRHGLAQLRRSARHRRPSSWTRGPGERARELGHAGSPRSRSCPDGMDRRLGVG